MGSEPIVSSRPGVYAAVVACGGLVAAAAAGGVTGLMGGVAAWSAVLVAITAVPAMLPALLGERTVPSKYGAFVLFGMSGQMLVTLGAALLVRVAADVSGKPFLGGVAAGAGVLLCAQVAVAVWTLNRVAPTAVGPARGGEGDTDA